MLGNEKHKEVTERANFRELLELWNNIFGDAIYEASKQCEILLRKPENFPNEDGMVLI